MNIYIPLKFDTNTCEISGHTRCGRYGIGLVGNVKVKLVSNDKTLPSNPIVEKVDDDKGWE